jgi:hypothetical protein
MIFDPEKPLKTDPAYEHESFDYAWRLSKAPSTYYAWLQPVVSGVSFHPDIEPTTVELGNGVILFIYYGLSKQELLYRIVFTTGFPSRIILKPAPFTLFWSYGTEGGQSYEIKYLHRDRLLSLHEWTDKNSFLAVLRQSHYDNNINTIWTR